MAPQNEAADDRHQADPQPEQAGLLRREPPLADQESDEERGVDDVGEPEREIDGRQMPHHTGSPHRPPGERRRPGPRAVQKAIRFRLTDRRQPVLCRTIAEQPGAQHEHAQRHGPQDVPAYAPPVSTVPSQDERDQRAGHDQSQARSAHGGTRSDASPPRAEPRRNQSHSGHVSPGAAHTRQETSHSCALEAGQEPCQHHP